MQNTNCDDPGTLVWVGTTSHPEFVDAFRFCRQHAAQLAVRRSPKELVDRPAGMVKRILFARVDRRPLPGRTESAIAQRYPGAEWLALTSSVCDGEARSGTPWPKSRHVRFSRWGEALPTWLTPCGHSPDGVTRAGTTLVLCDRYEMAEPYLEVAASLGHPIIWQRTFSSLTVHNFDRVLWDDSVAAPTTLNGWQQRLGVASNAKHIWLVTHPQVSEIHAAIAGGITDVLTKPVTLHSLFPTTHSNPE